MAQVNRENFYRLLAAILSLIVGFALLGLKLWAYDLTSSQAVLSDALEGLVNVAAAVLALVVILGASKPADDDHPYGHGKLENFSAAFEGGLIAFAAIMIFAEAIQALMRGSRPEELSLGALILAGAGVVNFLVGLILLLVGRRLKSLALRASGIHLISDFATSVVIVGGLLMMEWTGLKWLDPFFAMLAAAYLAWAGYRIVREASGGLMDKEDPEVMEELRKIFSRHLFPGIIQLHHVRVIRSGQFHHVDAHVVVPEFWDIAEAHHALDEFEAKVMADYQHEGEIHVHTDPCRRKYCAFCDLENCAIRKEAFVERRSISLEELRSPVEPVVS